MIKVENLTKRYAGQTAIKDLNFEVGKGEIMGFLGPNGAGKTTTMRILASFMPPTSGRATIAGFDIFEQSLQARAHLGYMPENVPLYNDMRVTEYLDYRAALKGVPHRRVAERVGDVKELCGVKEVEKKLIGTLSKGYRQRVGLADALLHEPDLLILDEPTIGLDPNQIRQVRQLIKNLGKQHTILLSTHILPEVEMTCSRVIIIHNGRIEACDTPENLLGQIRRAGGVVLEAKVGNDNGAEELKKISGVRDVTTEAEDDWKKFSLRVESGVDAFCEADRDCVDRRELRGIPAFRLSERPRAGLPQRDGARGSEVRRGPLDHGRAAFRFSLCVARRVVDRRAKENGRMNDLVDHARAQRALRCELACGEDHVKGSRKADEPRQPLRSAGCRDEAETRLGQPDANVRGVSGNPRVARECDLQAAAERGAVDGRDGHERKRGEVVQHALHRPARLLDVTLRRAPQQREIGSSDELAFLAARDDETARACVARRGDRRGEIFHEPHVDRVHRITGTVDDDPRHARGIRRNERDRWSRVLCDGRRGPGGGAPRDLGDHAARSRMIAAPLPPAAQAVARP